MPLKLKAENFTLNGKRMVLSGMVGSGYTIVLFQAATCPGCQKVGPVFEQFEIEMGSSELRFATIDVYDHRQVIDTSRKSDTPIPSVPHLIIYSGETPYMRYTGNFSSTSVKQFINSVAQRSKTAPTFVQPKVPAVHSIYDTRTSSRGQYNVLNQEYDSEQENRLAGPQGVIPHNSPWDAPYKKLELEISGRE